MEGREPVVLQIKGSRFHCDGSRRPGAGVIDRVREVGEKRAKSYGPKTRSYLGRKVLLS